MERAREEEGEEDGAVARWEGAARQAEDFVGQEAGGTFEVVSEILVPQFADGGSLALPFIEAFVAEGMNSPPEPSHGVGFGKRAEHGAQLSYLTGL